MKSFTRDGEWSGDTVKQKKAGWTVTFWSIVSGMRNGRVALVKPRSNLRHGEDLSADWNEHMYIGDYVALLAKEDPDKVIRAGNIVC